MTRTREYRYIAQVRLSHAVTGAYTEPGQACDVSHLTPAQLDHLLADGALVALPLPLPKRLTTDADEPAQEE